MATYTTYNQVGQAEDVSDIITDITPTDSPFTSLMKSEKTHARTFEWQEDSLSSAQVNAAVEGADAQIGTLTPTTMRSNTSQILTKAFQVSATADVIKTYGRAKETAYQLGRVLKEMKRDQERAYVGVSQAAVAGTASAARKMASVDQMITASTAAGSAALTETHILTAGQAAYEAGSTPDVLMIKPADALIVANFAASSGRNREFASTKTLVNVIDIYVGPFGTYKCILNRHSLSTVAWLIDPSMFKQVVLRPYTRTLLAKTGDSDKHQIVYEGSVKHMSFADSHMITGLT